MGDSQKTYSRNGVGLRDLFIGSSICISRPTVGMWVIIIYRDCGLYASCIAIHTYLLLVTAVCGGVLTLLEFFQSHPYICQVPAATLVLTDEQITLVIDRVMNDPPDDFEFQHNSRIKNFQRNSKPFIDLFENRSRYVTALHEDCGAKGNN